MKVTYYRHACISVEVANRVLLFDPYFAANGPAAAVGPSNVWADYILVSHGHHDHVSDTAGITKRTGATVISNFEITQWLSGKGVRKILPLNLGGVAQLDFGAVKFVNGVHSSSLPDGSYGGCPGGFVVETAQGDFYFSGDTALSYDMKLIGETTKLRFTALCLGGTFTMGLDEGVKAAEYLRCNNVLGIHFDTVPVIRIDRAAAVAKFGAAVKKLVLLDVGQSHEF